MKYHKNFQGNQKKKKKTQTNHSEEIHLQPSTQTYQFLFKADITHVGTEFGSITGVIFS